LSLPAVEHVSHHSHPFLRGTRHTSAPPSFFIYRSGHHRDLHSFPTRRSSDLYKPIIVAYRNGAPVRLTDVAKVFDGTENLGDVRSEEHTSELQSLAYLVCRLLLEKKKQTKPFCRRSFLTSLAFSRRCPRSDGF